LERKVRELKTLSKQLRLLLLPFVLFVCLAVPSMASAAQVVAGMPFTGKWAYNVNVNPPYTDSNSSHPSVHTNYYGDWATDIYAADGTAVKLHVSSSDGTLSFYWIARTDGTCGHRAVIGVRVNGTDVGSIYYEHLANAVTSGTITNGMTIGNVHDWGGCNPGPHVHVELKNTSNFACYTDWGHPGASLLEGDSLGQLGSSNTGSRQACTSDSGSSNGPRIAFLTSAGELYAKEGALNAGWSLVNQGVSSFEMSASRIAITDSSGNLYIKDGPLNNTWKPVASSFTSYHVTDNAVYVLWGTDLYVKQGSLDSGWQLILNPVSDFQVSPAGHIAARMTNGHLLVQWGAVGSGWNDVATGFSVYHLTDTMLAALFGTDLYVKQGSPLAGWGLILNPVSDFRLSQGNHIAAVMTNGHLLVQWGAVGSGWNDVATGFSSYAITDSRLGAVFGGSLSVKEGGPLVGWSPIATGVSGFGLS
jgi:hypothetical protein